MWQESDNTYRTLVGSSVTPMAYYAIDGTFLFLNPAGARNLGVSPDDVLGLSLFEALPDEASKIQKRFFSMAKSGIAQQYVDVLNLKTGTRWFYSTAQPVRGAFGKSLAIQVISEDVTELKRADMLLSNILSRLKIDQGKRHDYTTRNLYVDIEKALSQLRPYLNETTARHNSDCDLGVRNGGSSTDQAMTSEIPSATQDFFEKLTAREKEVFQLTAEGCDRVEIAKRLIISPRTAEIHRANAMRKLGIHTRIQLIKFALKHGMLSIED